MIEVHISKNFLNKKQMLKPTLKLDAATIQQFSDQKLYALCQEFGNSARLWLKRFAALLPEVNKRQLYRKRGFHSIYEFAAKVAGMSQFTVDDVLMIAQKLSDKPNLLNLMSDYGWTKLKIVLAVVTVETDQFWAEKVQKMSRATLLTYISELRKTEFFYSQSKNNLNLLSADVQLSFQSGAQPNLSSDLRTGIQHGLSIDGRGANFTDVQDVSRFISGNSTMADVSQKMAMTFRVDVQTETKLRIFKHTFEKQNKQVVEWNEVMDALVKIADEHRRCKKLKAIEGDAVSVTDLNAMAQKIQEKLPSVSGRYIPAMVRNYLDERYHQRCAYPGCKFPAVIYHHTRRFSLIPSHDPRFLIPLCKNHERMAHHGLIENEERSPPDWKLLLQPRKNLPKYQVDQVVERFRNLMRRRK